MAGTKQGAAKAKATNILRHGDNFFGEIGAIGGRRTGVKKGFAADPERARLAGIKGGTRSKRGKAHLVEPTSDSRVTNERKSYSLWQGQKKVQGNGQNAR